MRTQQAVIAMGGRQEYFVSYSFPFGVRPLARQHDLEVFGCHTRSLLCPKRLQIFCAPLPHGIRAKRGIFEKRKWMKHSQGCPSLQFSQCPSVWGCLRHSSSANSDGTKMLSTCVNEFPLQRSHRQMR